MHKFAFRNLWLKRTRSLLALIGLSIAITGVIGLISISGGIKATVEDVVSQIEGVVVMQKDVIDDLYSSIDLDLVDKIENIPEIKVVAPSVTGIASNIEEGKKGLSFQAFGGMTMYIGMDPEKSTQLTKGNIYNPDIKVGRFLKPGDRYNVVIGAGIADEYNKAVGQKIEFNDKEFRIVGIFETGSDLTDNMMYIPLDIAQDLSGKDSDAVSTLYVELKNPNDAEKVATKINFKFEDEGIEAKTGSGFTEEFGTLLGTMEAFFLVISSVAIIVGAIGIVNTMLMSVLERTKEFGILKAIGWTKEDITKLVLYESLFLGIIGGLIGCGLGLLGVWVIGDFMPFQPVASSTLLISAFLLAVILGMIGGVYPAWRASKLDPVEAIRYEG